MALSHRRYPLFLLLLLALSLSLLTACGDTTPQTSQTQKPSAPTPTPTLAPGQQLLATASQHLNSAKTLHSILHLQIDSARANGTLVSEVWNQSPASNRSEVRQSTLSDLATGTIFVSDGKQQWQYNPQQHIVFNGPVAQNPNGLPGTGFAGTSSGQSQLVLNLVQSILSQSDGTLKPSPQSLNGQTVSVVHVVPQSGSLSAGSSNFTYEGDVYINQQTQLPVRFSLTIQGLGNILLDLQNLQLNQSIAASTFSFTAPSGTQLKPFPTPAATSGSLSLAQAQQQAGYHLLSIPASQTSYILQGVDALGAPGNQIYTLLYKEDALTFTLAQGKSLAGLSGTNGTPVNLRNTTAVLSTENSLKTLSWTEKGIGIRITGNLSQEQLVTIAGVLS